MGSGGGARGALGVPQPCRPLRRACHVADSCAVAAWSRACGSGIKDNRWQRRERVDWPAPELHPWLSVRLAMSRHCLGRLASVILCSCGGRQWKSAGWPRTQSCTSDQRTSPVAGSHTTSKPDSASSWGLRVRRGTQEDAVSHARKKGGIAQPTSVCWPSVESSLVCSRGRVAAAACARRSPVDFGDQACHGGGTCCPKGARLCDHSE